MPGKIHKHRLKGAEGRGPCEERPRRVWEKAGTRGWGDGKELKACLCEGERQWKINPNTAQWQKNEDNRTK